MGDREVVVKINMPPPYPPRYASAIAMMLTRAECAWIDQIRAASAARGSRR